MTVESDGRMGGIFLGQDSECMCRFYFLYHEINA